MIRKKIIRSIYITGTAGLMLMTSSCKKLIEIDRPIGNISTEAVFETDDKAATAMAGVYSYMIDYPESPSFYNSSFDVYGLLIGDDGYLHVKAEVNPLLPFYNNQFQPTDVLSSSLWSSAYKVIYGANAVLEGIQASTSMKLTEAARRRLSGQALFCRAYSYFYLVNTFGGVPLVTTTDVTQNITKGKSPAADVYKQIVEDLKNAWELMPAEPAAAKTHPDKYAAAALLARTYVYQKDWANAAAMADSVINSGEFTLQPLDKVFRGGSKEAIWTLRQETTRKDYLETEIDFIPFMNIMNADMAAALTDPATFAIIDQMGYAYPAVGLSKSLSDAFEAKDQRKKVWMSYVPVPDVAPYDGVPIYFSIKVMALDAAGKALDRDVMMLRLAETYLNRAEANAHNNKLAEAIADVNIIRSRAGLPALAAESQEQVLAAAAQERRVELFAEGGLRWFEMKRTGKAVDIYGSLADKQPWSEHQLILPIPETELVNNPAIKQNEGY